jgi:hypothetical protein
MGMYRNMASMREHQMIIQCNVAIIRLKKIMCGEFSVHKFKVFVEKPEKKDAM